MSIQHKRQSLRKGVTKESLYWSTAELDPEGRWTWMALSREMVSGLYDWGKLRDMTYMKNKNCKHIFNWLTDQ